MVCRVSSQAIRSTSFRVLSARRVMSSRLPIGVPTRYRVPATAGSLLALSRELWTLLAIPRQFSTVVLASCEWAIGSRWLGVLRQVGGFAGTPSDRL